MVEGTFTDYHAKYYAYELTRQASGENVDRLSTSLFDASVDLNPHQIEAALFALRSPLSKGVVLADEVGLGKTIEAGLVLCQYWAERKRNLLIICPASLRRQWAAELTEKFNLPCVILDTAAVRQQKKTGIYDPFRQNKVIILSYHYACRMEDELVSIPWHLVTIDEAHKLRNAHRTSNRMGQTLRRALAGRHKLLLTATPLQNTLMELYGLSTIIDEQLFGDDKVFRQQYINSSGNLQELRERLSGFVKRTLRKQVLEYVRYTERRTFTQPFNPSDEEQRLYDALSAFMLREDSYALPKRQRHLTNLILRKLLASSTPAVTATLERIRHRLIALKQQSTETEEDFLTGLITAEELEDEYLETIEESSQEEANEDSGINLEQLEQEIVELGTYIEWAHAIKTDAKTQQLTTALEIGFREMQKMGAARKAIIFTESRRTQEYLKDYLDQNGFQGKLVTFNGTNTDRGSTEVYQKWLKANQGSDKITGSRLVDRRTALMECFRDQAEIMIATEAAAEGVNLQFCSLVINYDLPWNPQRIEQRIGRCHRYGQQFDVVVINFINQRNYADQRVLELLTEKFNLFSGVFGASDEVIGIIESGVDFEKRIQAIYDCCRTTEEIEAAFAQLQAELETDINEKIQQTQQLLIDNFDEDIHDLLKLQLDQAEQRLDKISRWFWSVTQHQLKDVAYFDNNSHSFKLQENVIQEVPTGDYQLIRRGQDNNDTLLMPNAHIYRLTHPLGEWVLTSAKNQATPTAHITFDYAAHGAKITVLESLLGQTGILKLQRYSIEALERTEDHLLFAAETHDGKSIPAETAQKLMQLPAASCQPETVPDSPAIEQTLTTSQHELTKMVNSRNLVFFEEEVNKLDHWADDLKFGLEQSIKETDKEIKEVRRNAKIAPTLEEKLSWQKKQRDLERARNKQRKELFDRQDEIDERREALIEQLEGKLNQKLQIEDLFTIRWSVK
jgi:superfamily II DNA/RNA helicase